MNARSVIHDTFVVERTYPATPSRVFAAFASEEVRNDLGSSGWWDEPDAEYAFPTEFDFRVGGRERFGNKYQGINYRYEAVYYDIVPDQRLVYCYEMYANGVRCSVSVATIEFAKIAEGTVVSWTEQGAYLDGIDGAEAPALRQEGTAEMLDSLGVYLKQQV